MTDDVPQVAPEVAAPAVPAPEVLVAPVEKSWAEVVVLCNGKIGPKEGRPVIVVESRGDDGVLLQGRIYPPEGDIYYRTEPTIDFGVDPSKTVLTLGYDLGQYGTKGFSKFPGGVNVGPASPPYGAANLAFQRGAMTIDIVGLSQAQKDHLSPWIAELTQDPSLPAGLKVNLV